MPEFIQSLDSEVEHVPVLTHTMVIIQDDLFCIVLTEKQLRCACGCAWCVAGIKPRALCRLCNYSTSEVRAGPRLHVTLLINFSIKKEKQLLTGRHRFC